MLNHAGRRSLLIGGLATAAAGAIVLPARADSASPTEHSPATPIAALRRLLAGNQRFVSGHALHPRQTVQYARGLAASQDPFVIVLGCADSRVPPEILFDQGLGDVFDNRVAGNVVDDLLLGSIEYAVEHFAPPVLMVLGHENCGAVTATIELIKSGGQAPGHIATIVDALRPVIEPVLNQPGDTVDNAVRANVAAQAYALVQRSQVVHERVTAGELVVVGARYDLDEARVTVLA